MKKPKTFLQKVFIVYLVIFVSFIIGLTIIGGEALSGKIENNKYYVKGSRMDKDGFKIFTEVNKATYTYSKIHMWVLFVATATLAVAVIKEKILSIRKPVKS